jgi:hypothetical protein
MQSFSNKRLTLESGNLAFENGGRINPEERDAFMQMMVERWNAVEEVIRLGDEWTGPLGDDLDMAVDRILRRAYLGKGA